MFVDFKQLTLVGEFNADRVETGARDRTLFLKVAEVPLLEQRDLVIIG